jgi:hypothetical protein
MKITHFSLDHEGALLAVGHGNGYLSIYDVDEVFIQIMNKSRLVLSKSFYFV